MQFGRLSNTLVDDIDFSLPPDTEGTKKTLSDQQAGNEFKIYVGAPKWGDKSWVGKIYPPKTPVTDFLPYYCRNFNTVEFGPTFYSIQTAQQLSRWVEQVKSSPEFRFCPKFPQTISHVYRLVNVAEQTTRFYDSLVAFGNQIGPLFLQLGDNFTPKSFPQLKSYLESLPKGIKVNVELRHHEWFSDDLNRNQLFELFRSLGIGSVISDTSGRRDVMHMELTTDEAFIRFVGNDLDPSDYTRMDEWVERLKIWKGMGLKKVWFFMHQNDEKNVPEACDYLIKQLNEKLGTAIARPKFMNDAPPLI
jgi:uncharacterized protein YecE (DUF72 family)